MRLLLFALLTICSFSASYAQFSPGPSIAGGIMRRNNVMTEEKRNKAQYWVDLAYDAYEKGDLESTKKYLDESQKDGRATEDFYALLGHISSTKNNTIMRRDIGPVVQKRHFARYVRLN